MVQASVFSTVVSNLADPVMILMIAATVVYGIIFGVVPGLGPPIAIILLIPVTVLIDPSMALAMMGAAYVSSVYGGSISAILLNVPGEPTSIATTFDGYPMTKKGEAHIALGASVFSSTLGGLLSLLVLILVAKPAADIAIRFGAQEFFALGIFGLAIVAAISRGSILKSVVATLIGLFIAVIGFSPMTGVRRFTFGSSYLSQGIDLIIVIVGLFAVSEAMILIEKGGQIADTDEEVTVDVSRDLWVGVRAALNRPVAVLRASIIGIVFGLIPALGAAVANFVAYFDLQSSSSEGEKFGTGVVEGIIAPEASNNAVTASSLVPTLVIGIPGNVTTAILLGVITFQGIRVGPELFSRTPELVYTFFGSLFIANVFVFVFGFLISHQLISLTKIDVEILAPAIMITSILGAFTLSLSTADAAFALVIGVFGFALRKLEYSPINMVFGLILGPIIESNFQRAMLSTGGDYLTFLASPVALLLLIISIGIALSRLVTMMTGASLVSAINRYM